MLKNYKFDEIILFLDETNFTLFKNSDLNCIMMGIYLLTIEIVEQFTENIGAKGVITFTPGYYMYIGSAMGKIGSSTILNRVKRHLRTANEKRVYWHIDYLLRNDNAQIVSILLCPSKIRLECEIASELEKNADKLVDGFGCSDCDCSTHLFYYREYPSQLF
jgi:Uri superfamily endonuclease